MCVRWGGGSGISRGFCDDVCYLYITWVPDLGTPFSIILVQWQSSILSECFQPWPCRFSIPAGVICTPPGFQIWAYVFSIILVQWQNSILSECFPSLPFRFLIPAGEQ